MRLAILLLLVLTGIARAEETARYGVTVTLDWVGGPGVPHPQNAHWSRLIAFAHSSKYALFSDGETASSGLALVATNGRVTILQAELAEGRRRDRVGEEIVIKGIAEGAGRFTFEMPLPQRHARISFATMLAPSPDWFTGASAVTLWGDDGWIERLAIPLWVWDAGADSGLDFEGPNLPTQPRQSVRLSTHPAFLRPAGMKPIGTAVFQRLK